MDKYKCSVCGNIYLKEISDEEAMKECYDNWGIDNIDNCEIYCDDCHKKLMRELNNRRLPITE